jgi:chemotaxis signal transduction protein
MSRPGLPPLTPLAELLAADQGAASSESQRPVLLFDAGDELFAIDARIVELVVGRRFVAPLPQPLGDAIGALAPHRTPR